MVAWQDMRDVFETASTAVVVLEQGGTTIAYANPHAQMLLGSVGAGVAAEDVLPTELRAAIEAALEGRTSVVVLDPGWSEAAGAEGAVAVKVCPWDDPARDPQRTVLLVVAPPEGTAARRTAERQVVASRARERLTTERVVHLQRAVTALAGALNEDRVLQIVVRTGRALGASSVSVGLVEEAAGATDAGSPGAGTDASRTVLRFRQVLGQNQLPPDLTIMDLEWNVPFCLAARSGEPFFLSSRAEMKALVENERAHRLADSAPEEAWALVPLMVNGQALGVLRCGWATQRTFPEDERQALLLLAGQCAAALDRARLFARQAAATRALQYSELRYRTLIQAVALDVFSADVAGRFITDMPHWRALTGRSSPTIGLSWLDDVHPEDRPRVRDCWAEAQRTRTTFETELRIVAADGTEPEILLRAVPVLMRQRGRAGLITEWVGTSEDVTEPRAAVRRAVGLQRITAALARALTVEQVVAATMAIASEDLGVAAALVALIEENGGRLEVRQASGWLASAGLAPGSRPAEQSLVRRVVSRSEPLFLAPRSPEAQSAPDAIDGLAWAVLPFVTTGDAFGALSLGFPTVHEFASGQRDFLLALAGQCAQALERARLFAREQSTAEILQRALMPDRLPDVPGLVIAARYQASGYSDVGGDWYDVIDLPAGGAAIVLGDVVGRGVRAASVMGQVRTAVRSYVAQDPRPEHVLASLDLLFATFASEELVTLFYGVVAPDGTVTYSSAGHLPCFLLLPDGSVDVLDQAGSTPLGLAQPDRPVGTATLAGGALLCVYSDGVVEHRTRSLDEGMNQLSALLTDSLGGQDLDVLADRLLDAMLAGIGSDDDASLLLVRSGDAPSRRLSPDVRVGSLTLPADRSSAPQGRRFLRERCAHWQVEHGVATAELLAGELMANAIVHAGTPFELALMVDGNVLRVEVRDADNHRPVLRVPAPTAVGGRGLVMIEALADRWGVDPGSDSGKAVWFEVAVR